MGTVSGISVDASEGGGDGEERWRRVGKKRKCEVRFFWRSSCLRMKHPSLGGSRCAAETFFSSLVSLPGTSGYVQAKCTQKGLN